MGKSTALFASVLILSLTACNDSEQDAQEESGEFLLDSIYVDSIEADTTYSMIHEIEWTGENPAIINSFDLVKEQGEPVSFEEDGIAYEAHGADPLKRVGIYDEGHEIGAVEDVNGYEVDGTGRIVLKLRLGEVLEDPHRAAKINYTVNGEEHEAVYEWDGYKKFSTEGN
ncbi:hypothetical protein [Planococcus rifietoensis]|uniref:hypothetical protein n=1 Tax=Planococcus rifietoensis TaxID=200991 RepID=UPI00384A829E